MENTGGTTRGIFKWKVGGITPSALVLLFLFASLVRAQDGGNEVHPFTQYVDLVRSPNLAVGASSLYAGKYVFDRLCPGRDTGDLDVRQECIIGVTAGLIFSVYGFYRIGGIFRSQSRSIDQDYQESVMLKNFLGEPKMFSIAAGRPDGIEASDLASFATQDHNNSEDAQLSKNYLTGTFGNTTVRSTLHYDGEGMPYVRTKNISPGASDIQKRDGDAFMDIYVIDEETEAAQRAIEVLANDPDGKGKLSEAIGERFLVERPNSIPTSYDFYTTTCFEVYSGGNTRISTGKAFLNDRNDFAEDTQSVYSGIDPCWSYQV